MGFAVVSSFLDGVVSVREALSLFVIGDTFEFGIADVGATVDVAFVVLLVLDEFEYSVSKSNP